MTNPRTVIDEQTILHLNAVVGRWRYRCECKAHLSNVASILELHYSTTLEDGDFVINLVDNDILFVGSPNNRVDALNLTTALRIETLYDITYRWRTSITK